MIDCHAHFYPPQFAPDQIPALAAAAREVGVQAIVVVPESLQDCHQVCVEQQHQQHSDVPAPRHCTCQRSAPKAPCCVCPQVLQLAAVQPLVKPCAGLHPVQPLHGPGPDQFYTSCRSVQHVSEVVPVLDIIRAHADKLVGGEGWEQLIMESQAHTATASLTTSPRWSATNQLD